MDSRNVIENKGGTLFEPGPGTQNGDDGAERSLLSVKTSVERAIDLGWETNYHRLACDFLVLGRSRTTRLDLE